MRYATAAAFRSALIVGGNRAARYVAAWGQGGQALVVRWSITSYNARVAFMRNGQNLAHIWLTRAVKTGQNRPIAGNRT